MWYYCDTDSMNSVIEECIPPSTADHRPSEVRAAELVYANKKLRKSLLQKLGLSTWSRLHNMKTRGRHRPRVSRAVQAYKELCAEVELGRHSEVSRGEVRGFIKERLYQKMLNSSCDKVFEDVGLMYRTTACRDLFDGFKVFSPVYLNDRACGMVLYSGGDIPLKQLEVWMRVIMWITHRQVAHLCKVDEAGNESYVTFSAENAPWADVSRKLWWGLGHVFPRMRADPGFLCQTLTCVTEEDCRRVLVAQGLERNTE